MGTDAQGSTQLIERGRAAYEAAHSLAQAAGDEAGMLAYDPRGVLKTVAFVQYLDGKQLYQFAKRLQRLTVKAGEAVFGEGEGGDTMFIVEVRLTGPSAPATHFLIQV